MLFCNIAVLDERMEILRGQYVGVRGTRIAYLGEMRPQEDFGECYDGSGKLLIPGLVNLHCHAPMTLLRGYGENLALHDWLHQRIFPFEGQMDGQAVYWGTKLAAAELLRFGVTSVTDMYFHCADEAKAFLESGMKCSLGYGFVCDDDRSLEEIDAYPEWEALCRDYHMAGEGRIQVVLGPHAEYTSTPKVVRRIAELAQERGMRVHLHLSETKSEQEGCIARHGKTPARYFADLGLFEQPTTAAHCVWLAKEDMALLREKKVTVAHCPTSNLKLASGFCPVKRLLNAGIAVGLGTDGTASNNNLNLFEEVKLCALLGKAVANDPAAVTPKQALYAATRAGALAQGREDCGLIREGFAADLAVIDLHRPHLFPQHDLLANLVYAAQGSDVVLTMVDGKVLYRDGQYPTIDLERTIREAQTATDEILRKLSSN